MGLDSPNRWGGGNSRPAVTGGQDSTTPGDRPSLQSQSCKLWFSTGLSDVEASGCGGGISSFHVLYPFQREQAHPRHCGRGARLASPYNQWMSGRQSSPKGPSATCLGEADCTLLGPAPGLFTDESVSHQRPRAQLAARGRRDEIASSNRPTYATEHRTGDRAAGAVPEWSDHLRWPGTLLSRRRAGSLLLLHVLLAGPILRTG